MAHHNLFSNHQPAKILGHHNAHVLIITGWLNKLGVITFYNLFAYNLFHVEI